MCIQVVERYALCGCLYYKHQVDPCPQYGRWRHFFQFREVLVEYTCPQHSSSTLERQPRARRRREAGVKRLSEAPYVCEYQSDAPYRSVYWVHGRTAGSPHRVTEGSNGGQVVGSGGIIVQSACFAGSLTDTDRDWSRRILLQYSPEVKLVSLDQAAVEIPHPDDLHLSQTDAQTPSTWTASLGQLGTRHAPAFGENTCPDHLLQSVAACPRECGWNVEQTIERGGATKEISRRQLHHSFKDSLTSAFANLSHGIGPTAVIQAGNHCQDTNSHAITDSIELDTLQSDGNSDASISHTPQLPTADLHDLDETQCPSTATYHTRNTKKRPFMPPCYVLIFLGLLTVIGSLLPGIWRASSSNDLSGGFSLAQYILGVGIFIVGSMVAIHSKSCECWKRDGGVGLVVGASH